MRSLQWRRDHKQFWKNHHAKCKDISYEKAWMVISMVAVEAENTPH
jgi:uncharacterized protein YhfF